MMFVLRDMHSSIPMHLHLKSTNLQYQLVCMLVQWREDAKDSTHNVENGKPELELAVEHPCEQPQHLQSPCWLELHWQSDSGPACGWPHAA